MFDVFYYEKVWERLYGYRLVLNFSIRENQAIIPIY